MGKNKSTSRCAEPRTWKQVQRQSKAPDHWCAPDHRCQTPGYRCKAPSGRQWRPKFPKMVPCLMALILWMTPWVEQAMLHAPTSPDLHSVELFSGKAANTKGVAKYGLNAIGYDKDYSSKQNIITETGFRYAISLILRVKPGGSVWAAPKCSSWIFMCSSHSKRSGANPTWHGCAKAMK